MPFFHGWAVAGTRGSTAGSPPPPALDSLAPGRSLRDAGMHGGLDDDRGSRGNSMPLPGTDATPFLPASPHGTDTPSGSKRTNPGGRSPQPRKKQRGEAVRGAAQLLGLPGGGALLAPPVPPPLPLPAWPGPRQPAWPTRGRLVPRGHLALLLPIQLPSPPRQCRQALLPPQHPSARPDSPSALLNTRLLLRALRWSLTATALA